MLVLLGPQRIGAGELDEGRLTESVVARYAKEDGSRGQETAERIRPARTELWMQCEYHMPRVLGQALRTRCDPKDQTGKGGVLELRKETCDWLDPLPICGKCRNPMSENRCKVDGKRGCRLSRAKFRLQPPEWEPSWVKARKAVAVSGHYSVVVDRDARVLLAITDPSIPNLPPRVRIARAALDHALEDALVANGRLILKAQLQLYSPGGTTTRADLIQEGALGCQRALIDYDASQARFSTYCIRWIQQGLGTAFHGRNLVKAPSHLGQRRRFVELCGVNPSDLYTAMLAVATARGCGPLASLELFHNLIKITAPLHVGLDPEIVMSSLVSTVTGGTHKQTVKRTLENVAGWVSVGLDRIRKAKASKSKGKKASSKKSTTGAGLVSALLHGSSHILSASMEKPEDDEVDQTPSFLADEDLDMDRAMEIQEEERAAGEKQSRFLEALAKVRHEDPEAAEVIRRHHGLESFEEESLEDISKAPLLSSGRRLCRESIRLLEVRGTARLKAHMACIQVPVPPTKAKVRRSPPHWNRHVRPQVIPQIAPPAPRVETPDFTSWSQVIDQASSIPW